MKITRKTYLVALLLFFVVFNPPLVKGLSFAIIAVVVSTVYCYANKKYVDLFIKTRGGKSIISAFIVFFLYDIIQTILHGFSGNPLIYTNFGADILSDISIFAVGLGFAIYAIKHKWDLVYFMKVYVIVGLYQAFVGLMCLALPSVKTALNNLVIANSHSEKIRNSAELASEFRNFGFASSTYDNFGFALTVLALMAFALGLKGGRKYYLFSFLIAAVAVMNGRSSFVFYVGGMVVLLLSSQGKVTKEWIMKRVAFFVLAVIGIAALFSWILNNDSQQALWMATAITAAQSLSEGEQVGFFDAFFNEFLVFPPDWISNIFGVGLNPADAIDHNSDTGYIQYLWKYGIVGSLFLYRKFYVLLKNASSCLSWPFSTYAKAIIIILALYLLKLACLGYGMSASIYAPICFYAIISWNLNYKKAILKTV